MQTRDQRKKEHYGNQQQQLKDLVETKEKGVAIHRLHGWPQLIVMLTNKN